MRQASLKSLRETWEKGYTLIDEYRPNADLMLVVLRNPQGWLYCNRYYKDKLEGWFVSVDVRNGHIATVIDWVRNPRAISKTETEKRVLHRLPSQRLKTTKKESDVAPNDSDC